MGEKFDPKMFKLSEYQPDRFVFAKPDGEKVLEVDLTAGKIEFFGNVDEAGRVFLESVAGHLKRSECVRCSVCGKHVSNRVIPMDGPLVVEAYVECPACIEKRGNSQMELEDGREVFPMKKVLMELGNRLVTKDGYNPGYNTIRRDIAQTVMRESLSGRPGTDLIVAFTEFLNLSEEARNHLRDLGVKWEM